MNEQKHTPGPWGERWDYQALARDTGRVIAHACGPQHSCKGVPIDDGNFLQPDNNTMQRVIADARLIAAAPDMLAALRTLERFGSEEIQTRNVKFTLRDKIDAMKLARTAIAKAEGTMHPTSERSDT